MRLFPLLLLPLCGACYSYAPIEFGAARPGMNVRGRVSATASERLAPLLSSESRIVIGTMIEHRAESLLVEVPIMVQASIGSTFQTLHQRVSISRGDLVQLEARKLDRNRTGVIVAAVAIVAAGVLKAALDGGPGLDRPPPGSGTDNRRPRPRTP